MHLEVIRIHVQFLRVQHTQFSESDLNAVHVLHSFLQTTDYCQAVGCNLGVSNDGRGVVQVSKVTKVPLGPWVHDKTPKQQNQKCVVSHLQQQRKRIKNLGGKNNVFAKPNPTLPVPGDRLTQHLSWKRCPG